ncbi:hypothetical protein C900_05009 [Fulvivirga imtechensis AK7]|uniref:histidine kinase n=1 Tax=Fulvivirga imtechensis AK7 TaxID=1237149 RepID=L8JQ17_9BACT|nr:tetratricopeptide repeat protein [Fulvivirga imtechensis]ELR69477.1 hypothetical protein C900_05009 [Fulvivirga imtechensis AK7]
MAVSKPSLYLLAFLSSLYVIIINPAYAQDQRYVDSLQAVFERTDDGSARTRILLEQAGHYFGVGEFDSCLNFYNRGLTLARKLKLNDDISEALIGLGNAWQRKGNYDKARDLHFENIKFCKENDIPDGIASSYNNIGNLSNEMGDYAMAIEYYTKSSNAYEVLGDELSAAITIANMGMIQNRLGNYHEAISYFKQANKIFTGKGHQGGINFVLNQLGVSYKNTGSLQEAMSVYRQALSNYEATGHKFEMSGLYQNIGNIYWEKQEYDSARLSYFRSLQLIESIGDSTGLGRVHNAIGQSYAIQGDHRQAKEHFLQAREIAQLVNNPLVLMNAEEQLKSAFVALGEYEQALLSFDRYISIKDSLQGVEKLRIAEEVEAKYQNEKKQKEIALLSAQNDLSSLQIAKRENERNYLMALSVVAFALGLLAYNRYKTKQRSNKKLQELNKLQSGFFANISHEFRTPLALILALLDKKMQGSDADQKDFEIMHRNARRLLQLINQLLDLSKLEAGNVRLAVRPMPVADFLKKITASFTSLAESRSIQYLVDIPQSEEKGYLDPDKIEKIVYNLLSNAFKFTSTGGTVRFECSINAKKLIISVSDDGIGISAEKLDRIFDRFYQVDSADSREFEGSGIGLALTKELAELHRGSITVASQPEQGCSFLVAIPLQGYDRMAISDDDGTPLEEDRWVTVPTAQQPSSYEDRVTDDKNSVILLAEDNTDLLKFLSESLEDHYTIIQASDGQRGYELAMEHIPDLIISDLMMPKLDGLGMCEKIKHHEKTSHIPVIMLTARADHESKLRGLETGADDYLAKPFDVKELKVKVRNTLIQRDRMREYVKGQLFFPAPKLNANDKFIKKAMEVIHVNISNTDFNVEAFNKEMGYSRMQLHRKIKAITGQSATEFIRLVRLKKAALLLQKDYDQVSQIAYETGFSSPSYFTKCFKEVYGVTPKEYAEKKVSVAG